MGSMIQLSVGNLQVDWGKNRGFTDHSAFFQTSDVTLVPYYYVVEGSEYTDEAGGTQWKITVEYKEGLSKPLFEVKDRITLLGHTIEHCRQEFAYLANLNDFDSELFEFEALKVALATVDVSSIALPASQRDEDFGEFFREQVFPKLGMKLPEGDTRRVLFSAAEGMENLSSHSVLRLLAENPAAAMLPVIQDHANFLINVYTKEYQSISVADPHEKLRRDMYVYHRDDLRQLLDQLTELQRAVFCFHCHHQPRQNKSHNYLADLVSLPMIKAELARHRATAKP
jgi:hypothetical protein